MVHFARLRLLGIVLGCGLLAVPAWADPLDDYNVAAKFYKDQQWDHAEEAFRRFIVQYPEHERVAAARLYEGQALVHLRKFALARDIFRTFVEKHPESKDLYLAMYRVGECSYFLGEQQAAQKELDRFISKYPEHELTEWALQYLAETQLRLGDSKGALASLKLQLDRFPQGRLADDARYLQAKSQMSTGDKAAALKTFQQISASDTNPRASDALVDVGMLLYDAGQYEQSQAAFAAVRTRFPQSAILPVADLNAGYAAYHRAKYDEAIAHFQHAQQAPKQSQDAQFWIGMSQKSKGDFAAAAATLQTLAESKADDAVTLRARFHWADADLRGGEHARAQAQFLLVVDKAPQGPLAADALHLATEAALLSGNLDEAERLQTRFERDYRSSGLWLLQRLLHGRVLLARGDRAYDAQDRTAATSEYRKAVAEFGEVVKEAQVSRTSRLARLLLARGQERLEQPADVVATLDPLLPELRQPNATAEFAEALSLVARAYLKLDRNQDAADAAKLFVDKFDRHEQLRDALASLALAEARLDHDEQVETALNRLWLAKADRPAAQRVTYQLADQAYSQKNWSRAAKLFQRLLDGGAGQYQAASLSGLGYSLYESRQFAPAAAAFDKLTSDGTTEKPLAADAAHMLALAHRQAGDLDKAGEAYQTAIRRFAWTGLPEALPEADKPIIGLAFQCAKGLARLKSDQKQVPAADAAYATAVQQLKLLPEPQQQELDKLIHEWAVLHYNVDDFARSDELFQQLIAARPDSHLADDARLYLGESQYIAGMDKTKPDEAKLAEARQSFTALMSDPKADPFVRQRALVLLLDIASAAKSWAEVQATAQELADKFPEGEQRPFALYRLGEAFVQSGKYDEAISVLQPLHDTADPKTRQAEWFSGVRLLLAEANLREKKYDVVEAIVAKFRSDEPNSPVLYQADEILGRRFKNEARWEEAREACRRVVDSPTGRRTETAAKAQVLIADTYLSEMKDSEAVAEYYKVFLNYSFPDYQAPALYQAAKCDERLMRWESAAKTYESLLEQFPEHEYAKKAVPELEAVRKRIPPPTLTPEAGTSN